MVIVWLEIYSWPETQSFQRAEVTEACSDTGFPRVVVLPSSDGCWAAKWDGNFFIPVVESLCHHKHQQNSKKKLFRDLIFWTCFVCAWALTTSLALLALMEYLLWQLITAIRTSRMEIQLLISGEKLPRNHDQGRKVTSTLAPIPSALRRTNKANRFMGAFLKNVCGLSSVFFYRMSESQSIWGGLVQPLSQAQPARADCWGPHPPGFWIPPRMETLPTHWKICATVWTPSQQDRFFLCSEGTFCVLVRTHCLLACHWAAEWRIWACLLCSIRSLEPALLQDDQFQLSQPLMEKMLQSLQHLCPFGGCGCSSITKVLNHT